MLLNEVRRQDRTINSQNLDLKNQNRKIESFEERLAKLESLLQAE